jgi:STE24 endopeptidase
MSSMRKLLFAVAAAAVVTAAIAVAAQPKPEPQPPKDKRFEVRVTPEMRRHTRINETLYFVGEAYGIVVLLIVLATGLSARMRDAAQRVTRKRFLAALVYFAIFTIVTGILEFPLTYYGDYAVPHQFALSHQSFGSWMGDQLKGLAISIIIGSLLAALALLGIGKIRRWWLILWLCSIPLMVLLVVVAPVLLDPVFNKFTPLRDASLRQALIAEGARAGIHGADVFEADKSKQTTTMNAYVTGLGPTKRMVIWDTTLAKMSRDEVLAVMGHEMGHYVLNHVWKGVGFGVLVALIIFFLGQQAYDRGLARWGARWGVREPGDPAALPWLLLIVAVISFLLSPVISAFSRHIEHQADQFGLELTHMNEAAASAFVKLAEDSKQDPQASRFIVFWMYSHPPINDRIHFVLEYKPWEHGQPNELLRQ